MSIAPWWCGIIIATKSASTSPDGLIAIPVIILAIATSFSAMNGCSSRVAARDAVPATKANASSVAPGKRSWRSLKCIVSHSDDWHEGRYDQDAAAGNYRTDCTSPEPESDCKSMGTRLQP